MLANLRNSFIVNFLHLNLKYNAKIKDQVLSGHIRTEIIE
jgi:hypothetical protein